MLVGPLLPSVSISMPTSILAASDSHQGGFPLDLLARDPSVYLASVLGLGLLAQWAAWRFRFPAILLLLVFGFLAGQFFQAEEIVGTELLFPLVSLAVGVILFEGGLTLRFHELKASGSAVFRLCSIGVVVTWALATSMAWGIMGWPFCISADLGAILTVTGPTVIAPLLRHIKPQRRVGAIAKWEGIVVDPIGAVGAVLLLQFVLSAGQGGAVNAAVKGIILTILVGGGLAFVMAKALEVFLKRHWIPDYLHALAFVACGAVVFVLANLIQHEAGLLAVTLLGVLLANQRSASVKHILEFKEHLRVLLISMLFIVLAGRIELAAFFDLGWRGVAFLLALVLVVRPACVFLSCLGTGLNWKEKVFLSVLAPRGIVAAAVASIFALEVLVVHGNAEAGSLGAQYAQAAQELTPLIFLVIVGTVLFYGLSAAPVARALGLASKNPQGVLFAGTPPWAIDAGLLLQEEGFQVLFVDTSRRGISRARMEGVPTCLANILSEFVEEEVEFDGLGRLLAVTPNDEVNSLAVLEFGHVFGKQNVFRLQPEQEDTPGGQRREAAAEHRGQVLFPSPLTSPELERCWGQGGDVRKTALTEEFDFAALNKEHEELFIPIFVVKESQRLEVCGREFDDPKPGDKVIALVLAKSSKNVSSDSPVKSQGLLNTG